MKTFENFIIDDKERLFLQLIHLDELEIKFNFTYNETSLYYNYKEEWLLTQDKKEMIIWLDEYIIEKMQKYFDLRRLDIFHFVAKMIEKYFGLKNYKIK